MKITDGEDTFFQMKKSLNCRGKLLDLSTPAVMAIINITPDSFFDGGKYSDVNSVIHLADKMLEEGADILDIGGQSTRPGAVPISANEEWDRIRDSLKAIHQNFPKAIISVDTFYSEVADKAISEGASIINDISAGDFDNKMQSFVCSRQVPYIIMHMQGTPENMQKNPSYTDVVSEVINYLIKKVTQLKKMGLNDIVIDPGFGFGKSLEHNYELLKNLSLFKMIGCPILAGLSRKSMITKTLGISSTDALNGTTALNTIALLNGASILRVHDVAEAVEVRKILNHYAKNEQSI